MYDDQQQYEYYNNMMAQYYGSAMYNSFEEYTGKTETEYQKDLAERAKKMAASNLTYEAVYKNNNLNSDKQYEDILKMVGGEENAATYGLEYIRQVAIRSAVLDYLVENVTVE